MQSWGTTSRFDQRDTGKEPSKSGVLGIVAAAMGIERENWLDLEPLTRLTMTVRHDRPGVPKYDYHTSGFAAYNTIINADIKPSNDCVLSELFYLSNAAFLVVLISDDRGTLERAHAALRNPKWPLALGRKSYVPSTPIYVKNGIHDDVPSNVVRRWPWITTPRRWETAPNELLVSSESDDGSGVLRMDQLLSSFAARRFGARFVRSEWIPFPHTEDAAA
jgi:CRISPR system Cascade subunit CasD